MFIYQGPRSFDREDDVDNVDLPKACVGYQTSALEHAGCQRVKTLESDYQH